MVLTLQYTSIMQTQLDRFCYADRFTLLVCLPRVSIIPKCSVDLPWRITILLESTTEVSQLRIRIASSKMFVLCIKVQRTPRLWEGW
jgi:hypothetical protein